MSTVHLGGGRRPFGHPIMAEIPNKIGSMAKIHFKIYPRQCLIVGFFSDKNYQNGQNTKIWS